MPTPTLRIAAISVNQTPLDWEGNRDRILAAMLEAREKGASILCCPELCISGYGCEDTFLAASTSESALKMLQEILPHSHGLAVGLGLPVLYRSGLYNCVCWLVDGKIQGFIAKQNLPNYGVHYEQRWFKPWSAGVVAEITLADQSYPLGDLIFQVNDIRVGFEICEDAWVPVRTGIRLVERAADLILNPSASHFAFGKAKIRNDFVLEGARSFGVAYVYANLLGNEAGRILYDGDTIIAAGESLLASGPRFSFQDHIVTVATVDIQHLRLYRSEVTPVLAEDNTDLVICPDIAISDQAILVPDKVPEWEDSHFLKEEEFTRSVSLGLFDYLRKSHAQGFVLSLSGGADSSACACFVYWMVQLGIQSLGKAGFQQKLAYISEIAALSAEDRHFPQNIMQQLLFCLYQRTANNSNETEQAASELTKALSASFASISIDPLIESYIEVLQSMIGRPLSWEQDDLVLQNIQARVRSPSIWLLANLRKALLICATNRSEAAVGYATMDGDTSGGICPIADIDKTFLRQWLIWLEKEGVSMLGKLPILKRINTLLPSAELQPLDKQQRDETDLMPYEILDQIEAYFVRDKLAPTEILERVGQVFPEVEKKQLAEFIERFLKKWTMNQWKRERLAPSFHLDDHSIDPKTWCRFPILSFNFFDLPIKGHNK